MKKPVFAIVFLLIFFCSACFAQKEIPASSQEESRTDLSWDFGKVKEGIVLKHEFIIRNPGDSNLKIIGLQPSCGCLSAKVMEKTILPKQSTVLAVSFDTKGEFGPVLQYVYVQTDSLDNPVLRYIIKVQVD